MAETVAPEYTRFINDQRRVKRMAAAPLPLGEGEVSQPIFIEAGHATELVRVAALRAAGFFRPSKHQEVVWVEGENELAVSLTGLTVSLSTGIIKVGIPVRCDQTGSVVVQVMFAVGSPDTPTGLYAAASRKPSGPEVVVSTWGEPLVAFAWQCVLGFVTGIAAATGKDQRGNRLVPAELAVSSRGFDILPMARHRFAGGTTLLKSSTKTSTKPAVKP